MACEWKSTDPIDSVKCIVEQTIAETIVGAFLWVLAVIDYAFSEAVSIIVGLEGPIGGGLRSAAEGLLNVPQALTTARREAVLAAGPAAPLVDVLILGASVAALLAVFTLLVSILPGTDGVRSVVNRWT